nr:uncharacterized protein LOC129258593 [Lytechinus pictus]
MAESKAPQKVFSSPEEATKAIMEVNRLATLEETQQKYSELDFTSSEVMLDIKKIILDLSITVLQNLGLNHLIPVFGLDKIPNIMMAAMAYKDSPEVMKAVAKIRMNPALRIAPPRLIGVGDDVPDMRLVSLSGDVTTLSDLHINKDRPMLIMASSAS